MQARVRSNYTSWLKFPQIIRRKLLISWLLIPTVYRRVCKRSQKIVYRGWLAVVSLVGLIIATQPHSGDDRCLVPYQLSHCGSFSRRNYFPCIIKSLTDDKTSNKRNAIGRDNVNDKALLFLFKVDFTLFV